MWVSACYKKDTPICCKYVSRKKMKSLYDNLKQKEGDGSKAGEFNASKGWFDYFRKGFSLKEAVSANPTGTRQIPRRH